MRKALLILIPAIAITSACGKSKSAKSSPSTPPPSDSTPPPIVDPNTGAAAYRGNSLNPQVALNGQGEWVNIGGVMYFVPKTTTAAWQPYQNGYWSYDSQMGWTWVSNDSWGWLTDHYGIWRHHSQRGWIWRPFDDMKYQAHCVNWFDEGDYVGWYPYHSDYANLYQVGWNGNVNTLGFDDGFWLGAQVVGHLGNSRTRFTVGFSLVSRNDVTAPNIWRRLVRDSGLVTRIAWRAHQPDRIKFRRVGRHPGGDQRQSFDFIQRHSNRRAATGETQVIRAKGGAQIVQPKRSDEFDREEREQQRRERVQRKDQKKPDEEKTDRRRRSRD
ncbi:MAG: DUF6600 domain-containing protein [Bdellovibrionales bacterium]